MTYDLAKQLWTDLNNWLKSALNKLLSQAPLEILLGHLGKVLHYVILHFFM